MSAADRRFRELATEDLRALVHLATVMPAVPMSWTMADIGTVAAGELLERDKPSAEPWPDCPVCHCPATSAQAQQITHVPRAGGLKFNRSGVVYWTCNRHDPEVYMNADGEQGGLAPDVTVRHGL